MDYTSMNFDWGLFEGPATTMTCMPMAALCSNDERKERVDYTFRVGRLFESINGITEKISDRDVYQAACSLSMTCQDSADVFYLLSCINLLNAAIKTPQWKERLSYKDIKSCAADLFCKCINDPDTFSEVNCYYNGNESCAYMKVFGVIFSFHHIRTNEDIQSFCASTRNRVIKWNGIRLHMIAPSIMNLGSQQSTQSEIPEHRMQAMESKFQEGVPRIYNRFRQFNGNPTVLGAHQQYGLRYSYR